MKKMVFGIIIAIGLVACSTTKMTGTTVANDQLQKDTMITLLPYAQAKLGCNTMDTIHTSPVSITPEGVVTERWKISGCNNEFFTQVKFTPSSSGGVGINISSEE